MDRAVFQDDLRFGRFELRLAQRRLLVDGQPATLGSRAMDLLIELAQRPGRLVTKAELMELVWPGLVVEENNLAVHVSALRKVLGGDVLATIPGRGYRFAARIESSGSPAAVADPQGPVRPVPSTPRTNLPGSLSPLIGRDDDSAALAALVDRHRLVSVVGAGGIGKTRLVQSLLADRRDGYPQGVCLVDLSATSDPAKVPVAIAAALGVHIGDRGDAANALVTALAPLTTLIALDNAEHLVDAVAGVAEALLAGAPQLRLVVTSQTPLKLPVERVYRLGPLSLPEGVPPLDDALSFGAVALFNERAQALDRRFRLGDAMLADVVDLCRRLDGVALAIELAAARLPLLGLNQLIASLDHRLQVLTSGSRTAPARLQTLRGALEWSHGLLRDAEQAVFRRLSVFAGSASLTAAQQVLADEPGGALDPWVVLDALGTLVDRSMVEIVVDPLDDQAPPRYRLLNSPLVYARERLRAAGEEAAWQARHARTVAEVFESAHSRLMNGEVGYADWDAAIRPDLHNGQVAVDWAVAHEPALALAITPALGRAMYWDLYRERVALSETVEALLDAPPADRPASPALLGWAALQCSFCWAHGLPRRSLARAEQALAWLRDADDLPGQYVALALIVGRRAWLGDREAASLALAQMQAIEDPAWPPAITSPGAGAFALSRLCSGDPDGAMLGFRRQLALQRAGGSDDGPAAMSLAECALAAGRADEAAALVRELVARFIGTRHPHSLARARLLLVAALLAQPAVEEARAVARDGWPQAAAFDLSHRWADVLAMLAAMDGRPGLAMSLVDFADAGYRLRGDVRQASERRLAEQARKLARASAVGGEPNGADAAARPAAFGARLEDLRGPVDELLGLSGPVASPGG